MIKNLLWILGPYVLTRLVFVALVGNYRPWHVILDLAVSAVSVLAAKLRTDQEKRWNAKIQEIQAILRKMRGE